MQSPSQVSESAIHDGQRFQSERHANESACGALYCPSALPVVEEVGLGSTPSTEIGGLC